MELPLLEPEQEELLVALVEASRRVPREDRKKFLFVQEWSGSKIEHPGFGGSSLPAYRGDIEILGRAGLLLVSEPQRHVLIESWWSRTTAALIQGGRGRGG